MLVDIEVKKLSEYPGDPFGDEAGDRVWLIRRAYLISAAPPTRSTKEAISMNDYTMTTTPEPDVPDDTAPAKGLSGQQQRNLEKLVDLRYRDRLAEIEPTVRAWRDARYAEINAVYAPIDKKIATATFKKRVEAANNRIQAEIEKLNAYLEGVGVEPADNYNSSYGRKVSYHPPLDWRPANKDDARLEVGRRADGMRRQIEHLLLAERKKAEREILHASLGTESINNVLGMLSSTEDLLASLLAEKQLKPKPVRKPTAARTRRTR